MNMQASTVSLNRAVPDSDHRRRWSAPAWQRLGCAASSATAGAGSTSTPPSHRPASVCSSKRRRR